MKACLIGYNLTNLLLAILLCKKGFEVDIIFEEKNRFKTRNRTIGISQNNIKFLKTFLKIPTRYLWPIHEIIILNSKNNPSKKIKFKDSENENFFLIKQRLLLKLSENKCTKLKNIKFKKFKSKEILKLEKINDYNFVINSQANNILIKKFFSNGIKKDYNSTAFTAILNHKKTDNQTAVQIFTKYGPLAFLPLSREKTSIVYSVQKKYGLNLPQVKDEILKYSNKYNFKKIYNVEKFDLKYYFPRKFVHNNILCFGDALHRIHPLAGQGFNMTLRDIKELSKLIDQKLSLGLDIDSFLLKEFEEKVKHTNYFYSKGIDLIHNYFMFDNNMNNILSKPIFNLLNKNKNFKKYAYRFANEGI